MLVAAALLGCRTPLPVPDVPPDDGPARYAALLEEVVTPDGYVDYDRLEARRADLDAYVAHLATHPIQGTKRRAYGRWLDAHNALALHAVLEAGRPPSVKAVPGRLPTPGAGFFLERTFAVDQTRLSLWEIEHERLRLTFLDPRMHAAMNCASRSCPPLRDEPYAGRDIDMQLDEQMRTWVNDAERGIRLEDDGTLVFSPIFTWFAEDFDRWTGGRDLCLYVAQWADDPLRHHLIDAGHRGCPHETFVYDWSLNHAPLPVDAGDPGSAAP